MSNEKGMAFRVEEDLRKRFSEAAAYEHRNASQVMRDLMRGYVQQVDQRRTARETPRFDPVVVSTLDSAERDRRERAVGFARASVGLEGFRLTPEDEERARQFINGNIDLAAFLKQPSSGPSRER